MTPAMKNSAGKKGKRKGAAKPIQDPQKFDKETSHAKASTIDEEIFFDVNESTPQGSESEKEATIQSASATVQAPITNEISVPQGITEITTPQIITKETTSTAQVTSGIAELKLPTIVTDEKKTHDKEEKEEKEEKEQTEQKEQKEQKGQKEDEEEAEFDDFVEAASIPPSKSLEKKSQSEILDIIKANIKVPAADKNLTDLPTLLARHKRQTEELLYIQEADKIKMSDFNDSVLRKRLKELWHQKNK